MFGPLDYQFGRMAQIRQNAHRAETRSEQKANRVLGIVWNIEGLHHDVSDFKASARAEESAEQGLLELVLDGFLRWPVAVDRDPQLFTQGSQALDVVRMLVGDKNPGEVFGGSPDQGQALPNLAQAKSGIDQQAHFISLKIGAVSR